MDPPEFLEVRRRLRYQIERPVEVRRPAAVDGLGERAGDRRVGPPAPVDDRNCASRNACTDSVPHRTASTSSKLPVTAAAAARNRALLPS
ncbi:hypothetical protein BRC99_00010 [Halobacteriales archaeon QS_7_69_60]|nr:MAG: hypothetical protein BRC99_00010 [Halobacteriales archaeon QS_7_69_60]